MKRMISPNDDARFSPCISVAHQPAGNPQFFSTQKSVDKFRGITENLVKDPVPLFFRSRVIGSLEHLAVSENHNEPQNSINQNEIKPPPFTFERKKPDMSSFSISLKRCDVGEPDSRSVNCDSNDRWKPALQTELQHFFNLFFLCFKVFTSEQIDPAALVLSPDEVFIFNCIVQRKFLKRTHAKNGNLHEPFQCEKLNQIISAKGHKRPEECYKFVYTRVLKHLKAKFRATYNIKNNLDELFYKFYFQDAAASEEIPLSCFFYPLEKSREKQRKPKEKMTLNSEYFKLIFKSGRFRKDYKEYTRHVLLDECRTDIIQKLEGMMLKWEESLAGEGRDATMAEIKHYLIKNKHCKLPWTIKEIAESRDKLSSFTVEYD